MPPYDLFHRYRPLIDDWPAFVAALERPLPVCVRANTLRISGDELAGRLRSAGLEPEPVPWCPGAFLLSPDFKPGGRFEYAVGLYAVQEEVSLLPPALLAAAPGQRVLDLCAAPGSKTGALSAALGNRGTVVANDRDWGRVSMVRANLDRLGAANVTVTRRDAVNYPPEAGAFDRILADVPCSCEGTSRKSPEVLRLPPDVAAREKLVWIQQLILRKAVQLCRPGGRIVYATCTYAPEENEAVVDAVLRWAEGRVRLVPARLPGLSSSPGLTWWNGRSFLPELERTLRVWPHQNDTGGFFVALLETDGEGKSPDTPLFDPPPVDREKWLAPIRDRFGLAPEAFRDVRLVAGSRKLHVVPEEHRSPAQPPPEVVGLPFLHTGMAVPKLTHPASQLFLEGATRNVIEVDERQAALYLSRQSFRLDGTSDGTVTSDGHVLLRHDGLPLGLGQLKGREVESYFPKRLAYGGEQLPLPGAARIW